MARILEVCVDSLASARAAIRGGADRLELCSALALGGLTPYTALLSQIREESDIPIRCLMRPRPGDFLYTQDEILLMTKQIGELRTAGADGFVIGCLTADGELDEQALQPLLDSAHGRKLTLHRCIDISVAPVRTYEKALALGFDTVLTSGAAKSCVEGIGTISSMLKLRDAIHGPEVLIGAGVDTASIQTLITSLPTAHAFHASCKELVASSMRFRRKDIPMGLPSLDEWHIQQTSEAKVRTLKNCLLS